MNKEDVLNFAINIPRKFYKIKTISLNDLIKESGYKEWKDNISVQDIQGRLEESPEYIKEWEIFCDNKRTSGGWCINIDKNSNKYEVGQIAVKRSEKEWVKFSSHIEAIAFFIKHELNWLAE
jgi:hypothetical protein